MDVWSGVCMVGGEEDGIDVDAALEGTSSSPASEGASEDALAARTRERSSRKRCRKSILVPVER